ncbi:MAG: cobalt ECF transporter T component CbiQ [Nitrospinae bacterium]|nr:cobalt ECF transporter T component CbiQ [Nitrospinota bacterium]
MTARGFERHSYLESPVHRLDARAKIVGLFAAILVCVSTPPDACLAFIGYFAFAIGFLIVSRVPPGYVLKRSLVVIPFAAMTAVFLPFSGDGAFTGGYSFGIGGMHLSRSGLLLFWNAMVKACFGVVCVTLLSATTPFPELLRGLERMKAPRIVTMLIGFTYRYLFVLKEEALRMKRAGDARGYGGRWLWDARVIGEMAGTLFLRGYERGERVYLAMASRGFNWRPPPTDGERFHAADWWFMLAAFTWFAAVRGTL